MHWVPRGCSRSRVVKLVIGLIMGCRYIFAVEACDLEVSCVSMSGGWHGSLFNLWKTYYHFIRRWDLFRCLLIEQLMMCIPRWVRFACTTQGVIWLSHPERVQLYGILYTIEIKRVIAHYVIMAVKAVGFGYTS